MKNANENDNVPDHVLNPWTSVWIRPRAAVRSAISNKPMKFAIILASIAGVAQLLDRAMNKNLGDSMSTMMVLLLAILVGPILGLLGWWISSGVTYLVGKWIGGIGSFADMKMAVGVSYIPIVLSLALYILDLLFLGDSLFRDVEIPIFQFLWLLFSAFCSLVLTVWGVVILIKGIAEVHLFSSWKGLLTLVIPFVALLIVILLLLI